MTRAIDKRLFNLNKKTLKESLANKETCPYCNSFMLKESPSSFNIISIDHIIPSTKGGSDELSNLIACCANCNSRKGNGERTLLPKFIQPISLEDEEYKKLNTFLNLELRIFWARELKELILKGEYNQALKGCLVGENNSPSKSFFELLKRDITQITKNKSTKLENKILKQIMKTLREDLQRMENAKAEVSHLKFSTYTLIS